MKKVSKKKIKKILIFGFLGLGDMVMFSPCLKILRNGFPDSQIVLVTNLESVRSLFKKSPYIDYLIYFDILRANSFEKLKFLHSLRKMHFDISISPYPSYRLELNLISFITGAEKRFSFNFHKGNLSQLLFLNNRRVNVDSSLHTVECNLKLMTALGLQTDGQEICDIPVECSGTFIDNFLNEKSIKPSDFKVGIHPGSDIRNKGKRLDICKFAQISDFLTDVYNAKVLLFLGQHEEGLKNEFIHSSRHRHVVVENLELEKIAQLISSCALFISNDSGLMHIASAMKTPIVAIFGPSNHVSVAPWRVAHQVVRLGLECSPCFFGTERHSVKKPLIECKIDDKFACIRRIEARDVITKVEKMIMLLYPEKRNNN
jgi:heptosyltransferase II